MVTIRIPTQLRVHTGGLSTLEVDGATLAETLESVRVAHPGLYDAIVNADGTLHRFVNVYVEDDDVRYIGGLATSVEPSQTISLIPAVAGG